jgi:hypothetical protein
MTYDNEIKELHEIGVVPMFDIGYFASCTKQDAERRTQEMLARPADVEHMAILLKCYSILRRAQETARPIRINKITPTDLSVMKGR